jgi:serine/threonine-protein kinase
MAVAVCPSAETLAAFARGDLADTELACVSEHVGTCAACCAALRGLPHDSLAELARAAALEPPTVKAENEPQRPVGRVTVGPPAGFEEHPRYRVFGALGAGGMGTVYKAEDQLMGRVVALKVVSAHLTAKPGAVARFRREIRAAAQLKDDHIVTAYDAGEAGGSHFLVMEYVEGVSLDRLVAKKGPLPVNLACNFVRQAALGLKHAADKGMVHRDIKPQNLMVTRKGRIKILDFGLARFASSDDEVPADRPEFGAAQKQVDDGVTNPNLLMGTPDYLSPEQAKNSHTVDARSDLYSLGCTLYYLLTGRAPFGGAETLIDKLLAHTTQEPPPVRAARPEVPEALVSVLSKMMAKSADDRYQTAHEVAAALLPFTRAEAAEPQFEIVEALPVVSPPAVTPAPVLPLLLADESVPNGPTLAEAPKPRKKKPRPSWARRHRPKLIAAGAALLVLIALASGKKKDAEKQNEPDPATAKVDPKANPLQPPANDKGAKARPNPWAGGTVIDGKSKTALLVVPSNGVFLPDFEPVRGRLTEAGVTVKVASGDGGVSKPLNTPDGSGVAVDLSFRDLRQTDWKQFDALAFFGYKCDEYVGLHPKGEIAVQLIKTAFDAGKPVGGICMGVGVLAEHGALVNRKAAEPEQLRKDLPRLFVPSRRTTWKKEGVVIDGKVVTADGPRDAVAFADALLKLMGAK